MLNNTKLTHLESAIEVVCSHLKFFLAEVNLA